ncbi:MAG: hypothetical protein RIG61_06215 [Deltaproteobacteria bacterium]
MDSHAQEQKLHPLKTYSAKYKIEGNVEGEKIQYSKDWGRTICWKEVSEITMANVGSIKKNEKIITLIDNGEQWIYTINLDDNTGTKMKNPMFGEIYKSMQGRDPKEFSEEFMTGMGGKVTGETVVNGEKCKEWELKGGARACVTEDLITVESSVDTAGVSIKETAVEVKRNASEPGDICKIGNAKITETDMRELMKQNQP